MMFVYLLLIEKAFSTLYISSMEYKWMTLNELIVVSVTRKGYTTNIGSILNHIEVINQLYVFIIIDREAREIIHLVASVRLSVHLSVCQRSHG